MSQRIEIAVHKDMPRIRLEDFLFDHFPNLSRMYLREIVRNEKCEVNGRLENVGFLVRGDDLVEIELDPTRANAMQAQEIPLDIVYEDEHLIVVNKASGMLVHPTHRDKNGTMLNALVFHLNGDRGVQSAEFDSPANGNSTFSVPQSVFIRPGLVHRLDKQTSGLIVIAKSIRVHRILARQFQRKVVEKKYLALVEGGVENDEGLIEGTIGRYAEEKRWGMKADGKASRSRYRVVIRNDDTTLLELEPVTGRTNQLRIHCASIGHPIVGDVERGGREFERLCLHAWKLSFRHPVTSDRVELESQISFGSE